MIGRHHSPVTGGTMRILYRLFFAALLVAALPAPAAQALDGKEVADKLITVVVIGGATVAGLPPPSPEQVAFMKEMVGCIIDGTAVVDCGKQSVIKAVLKDVPKLGQDLATCAISGRNVGGCAMDQLLEQVPAEVRPLVKCVAEGNDVAGCGQQFAVGIIDQQAKQATQEALDALNKLKTGEGLPDAMKNILEGAEGIREGDFGKIAHGFGTEAAKLVITIVVEAILGPEVAPIAGPVISEIVQNRADLIKDVMEGLQNLDPVKLGKVLVEFYLTTYVEALCSVIPDGGFKEATCGTVAKVISAVADAAADVLGAVLGVPGRHRRGNRQRLRRRRRSGRGRFGFGGVLDRFRHLPGQEGPQGLRGVGLLGRQQGSHLPHHRRRRSKRRNHSV